MDISDAVQQAEAQRLQAWLGKQVVVDAHGSHIILGVLKGFDACFLELEGADVHDLHDANSTREQYVHNAVKYGLTVNRKYVIIYKHQVLGISLLDEVVKF